MRWIKLLPAVALAAAGTMVSAPAQASGDDVAPSSASYYSGQAYGISATVELPLIGPIVVPVQPDTGLVESSTSMTTDVDCTASVDAIVLEANVLCPSVDIDAEAGTVVSQTTIEDLSLNLLGQPAIVVEDLTATAESSCNGATGDVDLTVRIGDEVILVDDPNLEIQIPGGQIVLNQQIPAEDGTGISVTALVVQLEGLADIKVGHAESAAHGCS